MRDDRDAGAMTAGHTGYATPGETNNAASATSAMTHHPDTTYAATRGQTQYSEGGAREDSAADGPEVPTQGHPPRVYANNVEGQRNVVQPPGHLMQDPP